MVRTKAVLDAGARLGDFISASLLARVYPSKSVSTCLDQHGRNSQRMRSFPATAGVYYCMALSLYPEAAYEAVFSVVTVGLAWAEGHAEQSFIAHVNILRSALPQSGAFPPLHPRRRHRWFEQLLAQCARLKAVRTTNKRSPRMVKRRNSPYASFSRQLPRKQPFDPNPTITSPIRQRCKLRHLYKDKI